MRRKLSSRPLSRGEVRRLQRLAKKGTKARIK